jgi:hypothetical protein
LPNWLLIFYDKANKKFNVQILGGEKEDYSLTLNISLKASSAINQIVQISFVVPPTPEAPAISFVDLPQDGTFIFNNIFQSLEIKYK